MQHQDTQPDALKKLLEIALDNCEQMILLINDILDTEKIASGNMRFDIKKQSLNSIINQAITQMDVHLKKHNIHINKQAIASNIMVEVDEKRLLQVLVNLLSNAIKFSPENNKVELFSKISKNKIRIFIKDSGLGLYISKLIMEQMGGEIGFNSKKGNGTVFWFELKFDKK